MELKVPEALKLLLKWRKVRDCDKSVWGCLKNQENMSEERELIFTFIKNQLTDPDRDGTQAQLGKG